MSINKKQLEEIVEKTIEFIEMIEKQEMSQERKDSIRKEIECKFKYADEKINCEHLTKSQIKKFIESAELDGKFFVDDADEGKVLFDLIVSLNRKVDDLSKEIEFLKSNPKKEIWKPKTV